MKAKNPILNSLSIDCVIFGYDEDELKVLLIRKDLKILEGKWSLPGGFVKEKENLNDSAKRILEEHTGLKNIYMEQFYTFGDVNRFPLRRVVSIAYFALIRIDAYNLIASGHAKEAQWVRISRIPKLAFDHNEILNKGFEELKTKVKHHPIGFELLPEKFTLSQLQGLYEAVFRTTFDKRNFRKKIGKMNLIIDLKEKQVGVAHRSASYFKFDKKRYKELQSKGFIFEM